MDDLLLELYTEEVREHDRKPRNFRVMSDANRKAEGDNPICGDHFTVFLKLENDRIADIAFHGSGCAISKSSASLMTVLLKGKTVAEAQDYFARFRRMVVDGPTDQDEEVLGALCNLDGVHKFPMRVKCAVLSWHAMIAALKGQDLVSTEKE
jgi:nitrogen fixation NifU-like protein